MLVMHLYSCDPKKGDSPVIELPPSQVLLFPVQLSDILGGMVEGDVSGFAVPVVQTIC